MRQIVLIAFIAVGHFFLSVVLVLFTFGAGMARFDTLDGPDWTERAAFLAIDVPAFPVLHLLDRQSVVRFPGLWGCVPFAANSLLSAGAIVRVWRLLRRVSGQSA
jgi:hypothetical protein